MINNKILKTKNPHNKISPTKLALLNSH